MEDAAFRIWKVEYGWIFAEIETAGKRVRLSDSCLGGLQMPGIFLKTFAGLFDGTEKEKWLCWHGESSSWIWHLVSKHDILFIELFEGGCSFGMPLEGEELCRYTGSSDRILEINTFLYPFSASVCHAFQCCSYGEGYEAWQNSRYREAFPKAELSLLRKRLRRKSHNGQNADGLQCMPKRRWKYEQTGNL